MPHKDLEEVRERYYEFELAKNPIAREICDWWLAEMKAREDKYVKLIVEAAEIMKGQRELSEKLLKLLTPNNL